MNPNSDTLNIRPLELGDDLPIAEVQRVEEGTDQHPDAAARARTRIAELTEARIDPVIEGMLPPLITDKAVLAERLQAKTRSLPKRPVVPSRLQPVLVAVGIFALTLLAFKAPVIYEQLHYNAKANPSVTVPVTPASAPVTAAPTISIAKINVNAPVVYLTSTDETAVCEPFPGRDRCAGWKRLGPVGERSPRTDLQTDRIENPFAQVRVRREIAARELARQHRTEDLQRDPAVGEARAGIVDEFDRERLLVGGDRPAEPTEADPARELQQVAERHARLARVRRPRRHRRRDRLVECEQAVVLRGDGEHAPEALGPAVERVRCGAVDAVAVPLENDLVPLRDDERVERMPFGVRRRSVEIHAPNVARRTERPLVAPKRRRSSIRR